MNQTKSKEVQYSQFKSLRMSQYEISQPGSWQYILVSYTPIFNSAYCPIGIKRMHDVWIQKEKDKVTLQFFAGVSFQGVIVVAALPGTHLHSLCIIRWWFLRWWTLSQSPQMTIPHYLQQLFTLKVKYLVVALCANKTKLPQTDRCCQFLKDCQTLYLYCSMTMMQRGKQMLTL